MEVPSVYDLIQDVISQDGYCYRSSDTHVDNKILDKLGIKCEKFYFSIPLIKELRKDQSRDLFIEGRYNSYSEWYIEGQDGILSAYNTPEEYAEEVKTNFFVETSDVRYVENVRPYGNICLRGRGILRLLRFSTKS